MPKKEKRHHATAEAWEWLEDGDGKNLDEVQRAQIRIQLAGLDKMLLTWDESGSWPAPKPVPADYWETAE